MNSCPVPENVIGNLRGGSCCSETGFSGRVTPDCVRMTSVATEVLAEESGVDVRSAVSFVVAAATRDSAVSAGVVEKTWVGEATLGGEVNEDPSDGVDEHPAIRRIAAVASSVLLSVLASRSLLAWQLK